MPDTAPPDLPDLPRRPTNYVETAQLAALLREHRKQPAGGRVVSDDLGRALARIAGGVWDRFRFTPDRDDFVQDTVLHLMKRPLEAADTKRNLFAYFSTCAIRFGMKLRDKTHAELRQFRTYAEELVDSGKELPEVERPERE